MVSTETTETTSLKGHTHTSPLMTGFWPNPKDQNLEQTSSSFGYGIGKLGVLGVFVCVCKRILKS